ncbi:MAG: hypothetical protein J6W05_09555 [Prevotella sp.]|nr:hypothetical protein [Prevotella sp.]
MKKFLLFGLSVLSAVLLSSCEDLPEESNGTGRYDFTFNEYIEMPVVLDNSIYFPYIPQLQFSPSSSFSSNVKDLIPNIDNNSCLITGLTPNTDYYFRFYEQDFLGARIYSNAASLKTKGTIIEPINEYVNSVGNSQEACFRFKVNYASEILNDYVKVYLVLEDDVDNSTFAYEGYSVGNDIYEANTLLYGNPSTYTFHYAIVYGYYKQYQDGIVLERTESRTAVLSY